MIFLLKNSYDVEQAKKTLADLIDKKATIEIKRKYPTRSNSQNRYLHLILRWFAYEYGCSTDEAKLDYFKKYVNGDIFKVVITNKQGKDIITYKSTSELSSKEMTDAIERFRNWSASEGGIYLPEPHEEQMLLFIEKQTNNIYL